MNRKHYFSLVALLLVAYLSIGFEFAGGRGYVHDVADKCSNASWTIETTAKGVFNFVPGVALKLGVCE